MRVAILQEVANARITVLAPCRLTELKSGRFLHEWNSLKWQVVQASHPGIKVGSVSVPAEAVLLEPTEAAAIRVDSRPYRGALILYRTSGGKLTIVNRLALEEYLVGALASEVDPFWPLEALKAHAVVSRTMVAHRIWIQRARPFDVTADTATHLYYGIAVEREGTRQAVEATRGQVLAYDGELLSATFHANCGGHTENATEIWAVKGNPPPLQGRPDPFCKNLRHFRWKTDLTNKALLTALGSESKGVGDLQACQVLERNRSGRVREVLLQGTLGSVSLSGKKFRELLGPHSLRSLNFTVAFYGSRVSFQGFGWGHGVGLCQWGAYGMAKRGFSMDQILASYFPNAQRRPLSGLPGFTDA